MGSLNVYVKEFKDGDKTLVWSQKGDQGEVWIRHLIPLRSSRPFQVNRKISIYSFTQILFLSWLSKELQELMKDQT